MCGLSGGWWLLSSALRPWLCETAGRDAPGGGSRATKSRSGGSTQVWGQLGAGSSVGSAGRHGPQGPVGTALGCSPSRCEPAPLSQTGVFRLSNEDYFIEPLEGVPARPGHAQPHVVYKRQAPGREAGPGDSGAVGTCGVQGMALACPREGDGPGGMELLSRSLCQHLHAHLPLDQRDAGRLTDTSPWPVSSKRATGLRPLPARSAPAGALD